MDYTLKGQNARTAELTLRSIDGKPFAIAEIKTTAHAVSFEFDPAEKATKFVLKTKIDTEKMGAHSNGRLQLVLTHPECSSIVVPFTVLPNLRADPPAINVLNAEPQKPVQKELWILSNYGEDFEIDKTTSREGIGATPGLYLPGLITCSGTIDGS